MARANNAEELQERLRTQARGVFVLEILLEEEPKPASAKSQTQARSETSDNVIRLAGTEAENGATQVIWGKPTLSLLCSLPTEPPIIFAREQDMIP